MNPIYYDVPGQSEDQLQQKCVFWFHNAYPLYRGLLFHVPNGGRRTKREASKFKKIGIYPGVADLILLFNNTAYLIELKDEKGKQSKAQKSWQSKVEGQNYEYIILRSLSSFKTAISSIIEDGIV